MRFTDAYNVQHKPNLLTAVHSSVVYTWLFHAENKIDTNEGTR